MNWMAFRDEYLAYRETLLDKNSDNTPLPDANVSSIGPPAPSQSPIASKLIGKEQVREALLFPKDRLVFLNHVHHETNKTTLKNLIRKVLQHPNDPAGPGSVDGIVDYVDYSKGLDSVSVEVEGVCYLSRRGSALYDSRLVKMRRCSARRLMLLLKVKQMD